MIPVDNLIFQFLVLAVGLAFVFWVLVRLRLINLLAANGYYGLVAMAFTCFSIVGLTLHKTITGIAAWGAVSWLLAILFGGMIVMLWGVVAVARSEYGRVQIATSLFLVLAVAVPVWILLEISGAS